MYWVLKGLAIVSFVASWSKKALEDRKVTLHEATQLAQGVCDILGVPTEFNLPE